METVSGEEQLRAYVTIVLDGCFVIRGLKIIRGPKGHFVAMTSKDRSREIVSTKRGTCWRRKCLPGMKNSLANPLPDASYLDCEAWSQLLPGRACFDSVPRIA